MYKTLSVDTTQNAESHVELHWKQASAADRIADLGALLDYVEDGNETAYLIVFKGLSTQAPGMPAMTDLDHYSRWEKVVNRLDSMECVSIACIDGHCVGWSLQLALVCDMCIATEESSLQFTEIKSGYLPGMSTFRLAKHLGMGTAKRLLFTGEVCSGKKAWELGIIDYVASRTTLDSVLEDVKASLLPLHPMAIRNARILLNESFSTPYENAIGNYLAAQNLCLNHVDDR